MDFPGIFPKVLGELHMLAVLLYSNQCSPFLLLYSFTSFLSVPCPPSLLQHFSVPELSLCRSWTPAVTSLLVPPSLPSVLPCSGSHIDAGLHTHMHDVLPYQMAEESVKMQ